MSETGYEILRVAERSLLVRFLDADLARAVASAHAFAARLVKDEVRVAKEGKGEDERLPVKGEWVLGAGNLLVRLDDSCEVREVEAMATRLDAVLRALPFEESFSSGRPHCLAVRFGLEGGPDLATVARETGLAEDEVVARFCAAEYTVAFIGFSPGFPYLIGLPPELELRRLAEPRTQVPAGSVAIAGPFAGVYPSATPGGWRLIGRTEEPLFDPRRDPPARFAAGDQVRFAPQRG